MANRLPEEKQIAVISALGMIIKNYGVDKGEHHQERRYSAPEVTSMEKLVVQGYPEMDLISTSHIERLNGTTRLHMRRLTRLTYAFSKKLENFFERNFWTVADLVEAAS